MFSMRTPLCASSKSSNPTQLAISRRWFVLQDDQYTPKLHVRGGGGMVIKAGEAAGVRTRIYL